MLSPRVSPLRRDGGALAGGRFPNRDAEREVGCLHSLARGEENGSSTSKEKQKSESYQTEWILSLALLSPHILDSSSEDSSQRLWITATLVCLNFSFCRKFWIKFLCALFRALLVFVQKFKDVCEGRFPARLCPWFRF